jgi:hypothetical protein
MKTGVFVQGICERCDKLLFVLKAHQITVRVTLMLLGAPLEGVAVIVNM